MRGLGQPPPFRITRETFFSLFSSEWQASNAAIIGQWLCMCHGSGSDSVAFRGAHSPHPAAAAQRLREIDDDDADADASDDMFHDTRYVPGPTSSAGDVGE